MIKFTKLIPSIILLASILFLSACSENGGSTPAPNKTLVGTWELVSFEVDINSSITFDGTTNTNVTSFETTNVDYELIFTESTYTAQGDYTYTITDIQDGEPQPVETESLTDISSSGNYTIQGNKITVDESFFEYSNDEDDIDIDLFDDEQTANCEINSNNELVFTQSGQINSTEDGVTINATVTSKSTWKKKN